MSLAHIGFSARYGLYCMTTQKIHPQLQDYLVQHLILLDLTILTLQKGEGQSFSHIPYSTCQLMYTKVSSTHWTKNYHKRFDYNLMYVIVFNCGKGCNVQDVQFCDLFDFLHYSPVCKGCVFNIDQISTRAAQLKLA